MATVATTVPYARDEGLATAFLGGRWTWPAAVAGAVIAGVLAGVAAVGILAGLVVVALARRRIGGFTGDVLGAAGVVGETVGLLVAAS
jgi:adenosylcobinamide-GDP ribazoletransferase